MESAGQALIWSEESDSGTSGDTDFKMFGHGYIAVRGIDLTLQTLLIGLYGAIV